MSLSKRNPIDHLCIKVACINTVTIHPAMKMCPHALQLSTNTMVWEAAGSIISFLLLILSAYIFSVTVTFEFLPLESLDDIVDYKRLFVTSPILLMDIFMIN